MNKILNTNFIIDKRWASSKFRNAMAHYKVGVSLKERDIVYTDPMWGLTQKFFECDYLTVKQAVIGELQSISEQIKEYLCLKKKRCGKIYRRRAIY